MRTMSIALVALLVFALGVRSVPRIASQQSWRLLRLLSNPHNPPLDQRIGQRRLRKMHGPRPLVGGLS